MAEFLYALFVLNLHCKWFKILSPFSSQHTCTSKTILSVLARLQEVSQFSLSREPLYWLTYNSLVHIYAICRRMMCFGHTNPVIEYLLWGAVCMESSVPLMAVKYLSLRANFYVAVCQCYYACKLPYQAEIFARRGLDKVHELAQLEHQSSSEATESSEQLFREVSVKLGVMVFKRSVLESRKKTKSVFRPKIRPTIRDLLQLPIPRSSTEKLLQEMFSGLSAQFLAVLESLSDSSRRPLDQAPPSPVTEIDQDTVGDVYQVCVCVYVNVHAYIDIKYKLLYMYYRNCSALGLIWLCKYCKQTAWLVKCNLKPLSSNQPLKKASMYLLMLWYSLFVWHIATIRRKWLNYWLRKSS